MIELIKRHSKRIVVESLGWVLLAAGIAALVLPGPGLLMIFAGMALLATQYKWAESRLIYVRRAALKTAADSVKTWPRIIVATVCSALLISLGIVWGVRPSAPFWWPTSEKWWLVGGWGTGATLICSGVIALATIVYSFAQFRKQTGRNKH